MADKKTDIEVKRDPGQAPLASTPDWEPIRSLRNQIDRLMADFDWPDLRMAWPRRPFAAAQAWPEFSVAVPPVDLVEHNGSYELQAELPGLTDNQIEVKLANGMVTIKGEKSSERVEDQDDYHLRERSFGSFQRAFRVPGNVDQTKIEARFENGVLKVILPKSATAQENARKIEVKAA
jgi:HSP20 family protein